MKDPQVFDQSSLISNFNTLLFYNKQKNMPPHDYKISKAAEEAAKRRPSIELAPSLEKPIYIVTKNMNGPHILYLIEMLEQQKIQYQLQQQTSTLGFLLNQRFFVIVDNKYGEVTLGADFASILMTIVGYPKIGKNKKNKYFQNPADIIKYFREFKATPENKLLSSYKFNEKDAVITEQPPSQLKSKIEVRSIIKYKSQESKSEMNSHNSLKQACRKECQRLKLIILEDRLDLEYNEICDYLLGTEKAKQLMEKSESVQQVRKKTLFHTNKTKIFYLANQRNAAPLINSIFIGEVIIYNCDQHNIKISHIVDQPKIFGVAYQKDHLYKILRKAGFETQPASQLASKLQPLSTFSDSKNSPFLLKNESNINKEKSPAPVKEASKQPQNKEMSKIDNNVSIISQQNTVNDLNTSIISKASSGSKRIKRIRPAKDKSTGKKSKKDDSLIKKTEDVVVERKKTLKNSEYYQRPEKSKKSITFKDSLQPKIRKVKSIAKVEPQIFQVHSQNQYTMTEDQYYITKPNAPSSSANSFFNKSTNSLFNKSTGSQFPQKIKKINGFFYREFVPKFHNLSHIIKLKPSSLFFQNEKTPYLQSFVYMKQYDRFVRRLKNSLIQKRQPQQYHFVVLLRDEDYPLFEEYCRQKNTNYEAQQNEMNSFKENYSILGKSSKKMNVFVFIEGNAVEQVISCGRIDIYKHTLLNDPEDFNLSNTLADLQSKIISHFGQPKDVPGC